MVQSFKIKGVGFAVFFQQGMVMILVVLLVNLQSKMYIFKASQMVVVWNMDVEIIFAVFNILVVLLGKIWNANNSGKKAKCKYFMRNHTLSLSLCQDRGSPSANIHNDRHYLAMLELPLYSISIEFSYPFVIFSILCVFPFLFSKEKFELVEE